MKVVALALVIAAATMGIASERASGEPVRQTGDLTASAARSETTRTICRVFGRYCSQALRVSWCESRWLTTAQNGQYLGLFQMGYWERRTYGHGSTAEAQSRAALRYFRASGRDWSPWSCRWAA